MVSHFRRVIFINMAGKSREEDTVQPLWLDHAFCKVVIFVVKRWIPWTSVRLQLLIGSDMLYIMHYTA